MAGEVEFELSIEVLQAIEMKRFRGEHFSAVELSAKFASQTLDHRERLGVISVKFIAEQDAHSHIACEKPTFWAQQKDPTRHLLAAHV